MAAVIPSRRLSLLVLITAAVPFVTVPLAAATIDPINDLRVGISVLPVPYVHEDISTDGVSGSYDWKQNGYPGGRGVRMELGWWHATRDYAGTWTPVWMVGINFATTDITPKSYDVGSGTVSNNRADLSVRYKQYGAALGYGLATPAHATEIGDMHWEFMPFVRGGLAKSETTSPGANPVVGSGTGRWWEGGLEAGFVLASDHWVLNPFISGSYGKFNADIDLPNNTTSDMTITTFAPQVGVRVGGRF